MSNVDAQGGRVIPRLAVFLTCVGAALFCAGLLSVVLRLDRVDLSVPLNYLGDANIFLLRAKAIVEGNWIWFNPRLGAPSGADLRDFPMNITLDSAVMWVLSRFMDTPGLIVNLDWMLGVTVTAALASYAFVRLQFSLPLAAASGIVFALMPYLYLCAGVRHLHTLYYAVPLVALTAVQLSRGKLVTGDKPGCQSISNSLRRVPLYAWAGCVIAGLAYSYTAFFAGFVIAAAAAIGFLSRREFRTLAVGSALAGTIVLTALADLSPSLFYWSRDGGNAAMLFKSPAEAQLYGLKIRYLITPAPAHPIAGIRAIEGRLALTKFPLSFNENEGTRLGMLGSAGFVCLLLFTLGAAVNVRFVSSAVGDLLGHCSALMLACMLLATVGGFGDFFNTFVTPDIRAYYRIFPFMGFFCITAAAVLLGNLQRCLPAGLRVVVLIPITVLAVYDQAVPSEALDNRGEEYRHDRDFVQRIETVLPAGSMVFQLPYTDFPNELPIAKLRTNDLLRPYLHSTKYRWSWPAVSGTTPAEWNRQAAALPVPEMLDALTHRGFSGLWLDLDGYDPGKSPETMITHELGTEPQRSPKGRFLFYDLRAYTAMLRAREAKMPESELLASHPVRAIFERGFYFEERDGNRVLHWSLRRGRITFINPVALRRRITVSMSAQTADAAPHPLDISWPGGQEELHVPAFYQRSFLLSPSGELPLNISCHCPAIRPPSSQRVLYFFVSDLAVHD